MGHMLVKSVNGSGTAFIWEFEIEDVYITLGTSTPKLKFLAQKATGAVEKSQQDFTSSKKKEVHMRIGN